MRTSLGLEGDLDDVELVQDIERAFDIRLSDDELKYCETVGDLFGLVVARLPVERDSADRCASAMCFYRLRRTVLTIAPHLELRPSSSIDMLRPISVKALYRAIQRTNGLRPPAPYLSAWGGVSLLGAVAVPIVLLWLGAPWWAACIAVLVAIALYRLSPVRLPPRLNTFGELVELVTARSIGTLAVHGARLRPAEAWKALQTVCADHAVTNGGEIYEGTLLHQPRIALNSTGGRA